MFMVIVDHFCHPHLKEQAIARIGHNGEFMAKIDGFLFRHTAQDQANALVISTVTGWRDSDCYQHWLKTKPSAPAGESPYASFTNRTFDVLD